MFSEELRNTVENTSENAKTPPLWQEDGDKKNKPEAAAAAAPVEEEEPEEGEISD